MAALQPRAGGLALADIGPIVEDEIAAGHVPGAVILVGHNGRTVYRAAFGEGAFVPQRIPMREDAIFDLASLTKVVATTIAIMQLVETGRLRLDDNVAMFWPSFAAHGKGTITIRQLLTHTSGLRPDIRESAIWSGVRGAYAAIEADQPICPPGTQFIYSDINFIVLGALVEKISGGTLDVYASRHIFAPLRMTDTGFRLAAWHLSRVVPTDIQRGALRWGEVQDPTAYRMGGVAGQAGLFSTADDLALFAEMLLHGGTWRGTRILRPETVALMITATDLPDGSRRGLGWDIASPYATGLGTEFGPNSFGHTGYTGTALWIDPATDSFVIILTSRLHPYGRGEAQDLRRRVAHVVAGSFRPALY